MSSQFSSRFKETPPTSAGAMSPNNITYRKKLATVSTSLLGDDIPVASSPRNCYTRNAVVPLRRRLHHDMGSMLDDEPDGCTMSTIGQTPVEQRAAEIRRMNSLKAATTTTKRDELAPVQSIEGPSSASTTVTTGSSTEKPTKKSRTSSSSLVSALRSRASSPIDGMRKFFGGRSSSKQQQQPKTPETPPLPVSVLSEQRHNEVLIEKLRVELAQTQLELREARLKAVTTTTGQQCDEIRRADVATQAESREDVTSGDDDENKENATPRGAEQRIRRLETEVAELRKECAEKTEDFRRTRKDFILILKEAVLRKNEAEKRLGESTTSSSYQQQQHHHETASEDDEDWGNLMSPHRPTLRRNALLMWVQKRLEPYGLSVTNFSSDWTDCRAFCLLLADLFPDAMPPPSTTPDDVVVECPIVRCRRAFHHLGIPFDERALGLSASPSATTGTGADDADETDDASSSASSSITGLTDWRYIMSTVFAIYKRGVLGK